MAPRDPPQLKGTDGVEAGLLMFHAGVAARAAQTSAPLTGEAFAQLTRTRRLPNPGANASDTGPPLRTASPFNTAAAK